MSNVFMLRRGAWIIGLGVSILLVAASWQSLQTGREQRRLVPPGRLITVRGHRVHLDCVGSGVPAVVISGGTGVLALQWSRIQRDLSADTRVCTWDRSGSGWSDPVSDPYTAAQAADDLWSALRIADEAGPFLLVGESYGGYVARMFQASHPSAVGGMVLVESAHERQWDDIPQAKLLLMGAVWKLRVARWLGPVGFLRMIARDEGGDLPLDVRPALIAFQSRTETIQAALAEIDGVFQSAREVSRLPRLGSLPLVVVSAGRSFYRFLPDGKPAQLRQMNDAWASLQRELCNLSSNCIHVVQPDATHGIARERPDVVAAAIRRGLRLASSSGSLSAPSVSVPNSSFVVVRLE